MKSFTTEELPPYYALSYCWGIHRKTVPVEINGEVLHVTQSLSNALKRLRQLTVRGDSSSDLTVWIWTDQMCINQQDLVERSEQVRLMGMIYKRSIRTIIWLGNDSDSNSAAWVLVDAIYNIFKERHPKAQTLADIPFGVYSESEFELSGLPEWKDVQWHHFRRLLELQWFTRVWVIQEVALSPKDPIILHGHHQYPWHKLSWAAAWLRRSGYTRLKHIPNQLLNVDSISCIRRSKSPWPLDALLCLTSTKFQATDQRDKIYGLLGLAKEGQNLTNLPDALRPDYGLDVIDIYQKVALYILRKYRNLSTLTRTSMLGAGLNQMQRKHTWDKLPSWVPNWCDFVVVERQLAKSLSWISHSHTTDEGILGFPKHYNACGRLPLRIHQSENSSALRLDGFWVDTVTRVVRLTDETEPITRSADDYQAILWKTAAPQLSVCNAKEWLTSYIKATTADHYLLGGRSEAQLMKDGLAYLLKFLSFNEHLNINSVSREIFLEIICLLQQLSIGGDAEMYATMSLNFCFQRSFFVTLQGRMGIGPLVTKAEDKIAIIFGGEVPYILRTQDNVSLFIGESYIHGLMEGEIVQQLQAGELTPDLIEIQ